MGTWGNGRSSTWDHRKWAKAVKRRDKYECQRCGYQGTPGELDVEADHITPVAFGGAPHDPSNGQTLCIPCHLVKSKTESAQGLRRKASRARVEPESHPGLIG